MVPGTYDDAVREAARVAEREEWFVVSDTSYEGYTEIAREVMQGYRVMPDEAFGQLAAAPTHVFIQGGVGGVAAAVSAQARAALQPAPALVVVEPEGAACLLANAEAGRPAMVAGGLETAMGRLACGTPSLLAWQELDRAAAAFMAVADEAAAAAIRWLAAQGVVSGEAGAAGFAGLMLAAGDPAARAALGLDAASRVLLFNTAGAVDADSSARLTGA